MVARQYDERWFRLARELQWQYGVRECERRLIAYEEEADEDVKRWRALGLRARGGSAETP